MYKIRNLKSWYSLVFNPCLPVFLQDRIKSVLVRILQKKIVVCELHGYKTNACSIEYIYRQ